MKTSKQRIERIRKLAYWLEGEEWTLTKEGLTKKAINKHNLRIAYFGSDWEFGETVFIGLLKDCEAWAVNRGYGKGAA